MAFIAIDFETANPSLGSICQVGVVTFNDDGPVETWQTLIKPEDYFDPGNVSIHGITEKDVKSAPTFRGVHEKLAGLMAGRIVAHHTAFDRIAFARALDNVGYPEVDCTWLDTAKVVRRTWPEVAYQGYGLANVALLLGIEFQHHAADEDARAAGEILLRAVRVSGIALSDWLLRIRKPISLSANGRSGHQQAGHQRTGNPEGFLAGETIVFTGALSIRRTHAADLAANAGCDVADSVTSSTTMLVVGDQDIRKLAGNEKSSKHRKAEMLISKGQQIRILGESDFVLLTNSSEI